MQTRIIIFPSEDGFSVLVWGKWAEGSMRIRHFDNRRAMTAVLENLRMITQQQAQELEQFGFMDSCPLYSSEIYDLCSHVRPYYCRRSHQ